MWEKLTPEEKIRSKKEKSENKIKEKKLAKIQNDRHNSETKTRKEKHKQILKEIRVDKPNQKKYLKEQNAFIKEDAKNKKDRIAKVNKWWNTVDQNNKEKKYEYKWKLSQAKKTVFDYNGEIKFDNISYSYSIGSPFEFRALEKVDNLTISEGKITAVIGMTGSGKSTLIQLINGLIIGTTGRTVVGNYQIPAATKKIKFVKSLRREVGLVFQFPEYQLFQDTIEKDISFGPINLGQNKNEVMKKIPSLLKLVDLPEDYGKRSPFDLSGGQKRRVAIAGIIASDGNTLVLDEPTGGLDPQGEEDFMNIFSNLNKEKGKRIVIVTHNMDHVLKIADEVIVMHKGKVIRKGTPFEVFSDHHLLKTIQIEPPKLYKLAFKLKEKGLDITQEKFRNVEQLAQAIKNIRK